MSSDGPEQEPPLEPANVERLLESVPEPKRSRLRLLLKRPQLTREQELEVAAKIARARERFALRLLACDWTLDRVREVLERVWSGAERPAHVGFGSDAAERQKLLQRIPKTLDRLDRLLADNRADVLRRASPETTPEEHKAIETALRRRRQQGARMVTALRLAPGTVETFLKDLGRLVAEAARSDSAERERLLEPMGEPVDRMQALVRAGRRSHRAYLRARAKLYHATVWLVVQVAGRFQAKMDAAGVKFDQLLTDGLTALSKAATCYDHRKGYRFPTYATWWVRAAFERALPGSSRVTE